MDLDLDENHFQINGGPSRPALLSKASTASFFASPTTALTDARIPEHAVLDNRDGSAALASDSHSTRSGRPTLRSLGSDLEASMHQVLDEGTGGAAAPAEAAPASDAQTSLDASVDVLGGLDAAQVSRLDDEAQLQDFLHRNKHFLILSAAGKPIYARHGTEQVISGYMGIFQAIMGFYQDSPTPDVLQSFSAPGLIVAMIAKGPIYLVAISKLGEAEATLKPQLECLYDVVVSSLTSTSMSRVFDRGDNFDLGRLLSGSESFMHKVCDGLTFGRLHLDILLGSLSVLRMRATLRHKLDNILAAFRPSTANLLYGMVVVDKMLASVLRPKEHSMYPADLRLIFETVWERGLEEGQDYWLPLCLPKFNSTGYLHVFVSFLAPSVVMILISADKDDFFLLQTMKREVSAKMAKEGLVRDLVRAKYNQVSTKMLGIDHVLEHFVFKNRSRIQYCAPEVRPTSRGHHAVRIIQTYETLQAFGQLRHKLQVHHYTIDATTEFLALSWVTQAFELYVIAKPHDTHDTFEAQRARVSALIGAANVIHQFVRREEGRLWLHDGLTF